MVYGEGRYLGDDQVTVVEGSALHLDEDIGLAEFGDGGVLVDEAVKTVVGDLLDLPLFLGGW